MRPRNRQLLERYERWVPRACPGPKLRSEYLHCAYIIVAKFSLDPHQNPPLSQLLYNNKPLHSARHPARLLRPDCTINPPSPQLTEIVHDLRTRRPSFQAIRPRHSLASASAEKVRCMTSYLCSLAVSHL